MGGDLKFCVTVHSRQPGSRWALEQAKQNVISNYLLVGVTEELSDFIAALEVMLPRFFRGAMDLYVNGNYDLMDLYVNGNYDLLFSLMFFVTLLNISIYIDYDDMDMMRWNLPEFCPIFVLFVSFKLFCNFVNVSDGDTSVELNTHLVKFTFLKLNIALYIEAKGHIAINDLRGHWLLC